jgi:hypothetical protein
MNIQVGDDDVRVEKSLKKNKKMRGHQEKLEKLGKPLRGVGKRVRVRPTISFIFG